MTATARCPSRRRCPQPYWDALRRAPDRDPVHRRPRALRVLSRAPWRRGRWPTTWSGARSTAPERCTPTPWRAGPPVRHGPRRCRSCSPSSSGTRDRASAPNWSTSNPRRSGSACGSPRCSATSDGVTLLRYRPADDRDGAAAAAHALDDDGVAMMHATGHGHGASTGRGGAEAAALIASLRRSPCTSVRCW